jgi:hypothetical protein
MANLSGRDEEKLATDIAKIRATARMRLGAVVGLVAVGLFQIDFPDLSGLDTVTAARTLLRTLMPFLALSVALVLLVLGLARRDIKRKQDDYESKQFRIPTRAKRR